MFLSSFGSEVSVRTLVLLRSILMQQTCICSYNCICDPLFVFWCQCACVSSILVVHFKFVIVLKVFGGFRFWSDPCFSFVGSLIPLLQNMAIINLVSAFFFFLFCGGTRWRHESCSLPPLCFSSASLQLNKVPYIGHESRRGSVQSFEIRTAH